MEKTHIPKQDETLTESGIQIRTSDPSLPEATQLWVKDKLYFGSTSSTVTGHTGFSGVTGPSGSLGDQGNPGVEGLPFMVALSGKQGLKGAQGETGPQGPADGQQGAIGVAGFVGLLGFQGTKGNEGSQGFVGALGENGPRGYQGPTGTQGEIGIAGITGLGGTRGPRGPQGVTGPSGGQGPVSPGYQGPTGFQGQPGATGAQQGITGVVGFFGPMGETGLQGITGPGVEGATGKSGTTGAIGSTGFSGPTGSSGNTGNQGVQGITGVAAFFGQSGDTGQDGRTGPLGGTGLIGSSGSFGVTGPLGSTGLNGSTGAIGATGSRGNTGPIGLQGFQGKVGPTGPQGITGVGGDPGVQGVFGHTGVRGVTGPQGETGLIGFSATGFQGNTGAVGLTGLRGNTGAVGLQGLGFAGPQGPQGVTGLLGAPTTGLIGPTGAANYDYGLLTSETAPGLQTFDASLMTMFTFNSYSSIKQQTFVFSNTIAGKIYHIDFRNHNYSSTIVNLFSGVSFTVPANTGVLITFARDASGRLAVLQRMDRSLNLSQILFDSDGSAQAATIYDDDLFIAATDITKIIRPVRAVAWLEPSGKVESSILDSFFTRNVYASLVYKGYLYLGGEFGIANGDVFPNSASYFRLIRINLEKGQIDWRWTFNFNKGYSSSTQSFAWISALAAQDDYLYLGGKPSSTSFTMLNRVHIPSGQIGSWNLLSSNTNSFVKSIVVKGASLWCSGYLTSIQTPSTFTCNGVLKLVIGPSITVDGGFSPGAGFVLTGTHQTFNPPDTSSVNGRWPTVMTLSSDASKLYIAGPIQTYQGVGRNGLVAIDPNTATIISTFTGNPQIGSALGMVNSLVQVGNNLLATWNLGVGSSYSRVDATTGTLLGQINSTAYKTVAVEQGLLYSNFGSVVNPQNDSVLKSGLDLIAGTHYDNSVSDKNFFVCGTFSSGGQLVRSNPTIMTINLSSNLVRTHASYPTVTGTIINAIAVDSTSLYLGGLFTSVGSSTRNNIVKLSKITGSEVPFYKTPGANGVVHTLLIHAGSVYIGGAFTTIFGASRKYISKVNTAGDVDISGGWSGTSFQSIFSGVRSICLSTDNLKIFIGGDFSGTYNGGSSKSGICCLNLDGTLNSTFHTNSNGTNATIIHVAAFGSGVICGFSTFGGAFYGGTALDFAGDSATAMVLDSTGTLAPALPQFTAVSGSATSNNRVHVFGDYWIIRSNGFVTKPFNNSVTPQLIINTSAFVNQLNIRSVTFGESMVILNLNSFSNQKRVFKVSPPFMTFN